jgi:hypothetical protein
VSEVREVLDAAEADTSAEREAFDAHEATAHEAQPDEHPAAADPMAALGFYSQQDARDSAFARLLLLGPSKLGKTTAVVSTAPGPVVVLNADGDSALKYPAKIGAKFGALDITNRREWQGSRQRRKLSQQARARSWWIR